MIYTSGIYQIVNLVNGKVYVGSAHDLNRRRREHFAQLRRGNHFNEKLQHAFNKYGQEQFVFEVLERCAKDVVIAREQFYLDDKKAVATGYNILPFAKSLAGRKDSPETIEKRASAIRGRKHTEEAKAKMKGRQFTPQHREKLRLAKLGTKRK